MVSFLISENCEKLKRQAKLRKGGDILKTEVLTKEGLYVYDEEIKDYIKNQTFLFNKIQTKTVANNEIVVSTRPNTFYTFESRRNPLAINFEAPVDGIVSEYSGQIMVDETDLEVTFPSDIR